MKADNIIAVWVISGLEKAGIISKAEAATAESICREKLHDELKSDKRETDAA